jgi:DNA-binding transcriptional LysR family regulator
MTGSERWAALEIRLLVAFAVVVDEGSFTSAARRLGYTQSGISQQIAALERIVDRKLLLRQAGGRRPIELTPVGEAFLQHCRALLGQLDRAYGEVVEQEQALAATARIAAVPSAAVRLVPTLQRAVRIEKGLSLELFEGPTDEDVFGRLDSHEAELGIAALPVPTRFAVDEIGVDPYVAVVPVNSDLAGGGDVTLPQLVGRPLLGIRNCPHEDAVAARLAAAGFDSRTITRYDDNRLIQAQVAAGNGIAVVPALTVEPADESIRILNIVGNLPPRVLALIQLRDGLLSGAGRDFKQVALPVARRLLRDASAGLLRADALSRAS